MHDSGSWLTNNTVRMLFIWTGLWLCTFIAHASVHEHTSAKHAHKNTHTSTHERECESVAVVDMSSKLSTMHAMRGFMT